MKAIKAALSDENVNNVEGGGQGGHITYSQMGIISLRSGYANSGYTTSPSWKRRGKERLGAGAKKKQIVNTKIVYE